MFVVREDRVINGVKTSIERTSKYPMPWTGKPEDGCEQIERPKYYYEEIATKITYIQDGATITILIPSVGPVYSPVANRIVFPVGSVYCPVANRIINHAQTNRIRKLQVLVNDDPYAFAGSSKDVLDMYLTFDIPEMDKLMNLAQANANPQAHIFRACTPFYMSDDIYILPDKKRDERHPDGWVYKTNGTIKDLVLPYIKAIKKSAPGVRKEIYIPVNLRGAPHHWQLCALTFDEHNQVSVTCIETDKYGITSEDHFSSCLKMYLQKIIPGINDALRECDFNPVSEDHLYFDGYKQFSKRGCGITVSLIVEKLLAGKLNLNGVPMAAGLEQHLVHKNRKVLTSKITQRDYERMSIEEDALMRVQLAFKLTAHDRYVQQSESTVDVANKYQLEAVLRELRAHPHTLSCKANEAFRVSGSKPDVLSDSNANVTELSGYEQEFYHLLHKMQQTTFSLVYKGDKSQSNYNPKYYKAGLVANRLHYELINSANEFFRKPDSRSLQQFKDRCIFAINKAEAEFKNHRGIWGNLNPIIKGILGIFAALTLIPALVVVFKAPHGYCRTFFSKTQTNSSEQLSLFKSNFLEMSSSLSLI